MADGALSLEFQRALDLAERGEEVGPLFEYLVILFAPLFGQASDKRRLK